MATQQFRIIDENGSPVNGAIVSVVCWGVIIYEQAVSGIASVTVQPYANNLVYVRFQSYTPVEYAYFGSGGESVIDIQIKTCVSLFAPKLDYGSFLNWSQVKYPPRRQTQPLAICEVSDQTTNSPLCDRFVAPYELEEYHLPIKKGDVIRWIMQSTEIDYIDYSLLKIGITQNGIMKAENVGVPVLEGSQVFCEAIVPCLPECDNYEFVIYRTDVPISLELEKTNPTDELTCNGIISVLATGGVPPYRYSKDNGLTWQTSNTFSGLCVGSYTFIVEDSDYSQATISASLIVFTCGQFEGATLQEMIDSQLTLGEIINAGCTLCDFVEDKTYFENVLLNPSFVDGSANWTTDSGTPRFGNASLVLENATVSQTQGLFNGGGKIIIALFVLICEAKILVETLSGTEEFIITENGIHEFAIIGDFYNIHIGCESGDSCKIDYIYQYQKIDC